MERKRRALITGATGTVGSAILDLFVSSGSYETIYATYKSGRSKMEALQQNPCVVGVEHTENIDVLARIPCDIDVLVNNAGIVSSKALSGEVALEEVYNHIELHVIWPLLLVQHCLPHMISERWGRIINIGSIWSIRGSERNIAYTVSKHALSGLTKTTAVEYEKCGITSNEICPGPIESRMIDRIFRDSAKETGATWTDLKDAFVSSLRISRLIRANEIASAVAFLASAEASGVNGTSIPVDLGLTV